MASIGSRLRKLISQYRNGSVEDRKQIRRIVNIMANNHKQVPIKKLFNKEVKSMHRTTDLSDMVEDVGYDTVRNNKNTTLHGGKSLNMLLDSHRETKDFDIFSKNARKTAHRIENELDKRAGKDIARVTRKTIPNVTGSDDATASDTLYEVDVKGNLPDFDVMQNPKDLKRTKKQRIYHQTLEQQYERKLKNFNQPLRAFKSRQDAKRIESFWATKGKKVPSMASKETKFMPFKVTPLVPIKTINPFGSPGQLPPFGDIDGDRVPNAWDCDPLDPMKQGPIHDAINRLRGIPREEPVQANGSIPQDVPQLQARNPRYYKKRIKKGVTKLGAGIASGAIQLKEFSGAVKDEYHNIKETMDEKGMNTPKTQMFRVSVFTDLPPDERTGESAGKGWLDIGQEVTEQQAREIYAKLTKEGYKVNVKQAGFSRGKQWKQNINQGLFKQPQQGIISQSNRMQQPAMYQVGRNREPESYSPERMTKEAQKQIIKSLMLQGHTYWESVKIMREHFMHHGERAVTYDIPAPKKMFMRNGKPSSIPDLSPPPYVSIDKDFRPRFFDRPYMPPTTVAGSVQPQWVGYERGQSRGMGYRPHFVR